MTIEEQTKRRRFELLEKELNAESNMSTINDIVMNHYDHGAITDDQMVYLLDTHYYRLKRLGLS